MRQLWITFVITLVALLLFAPVFRVLLWAATAGAWWLYRWRGEQATFPCPVCGYDLRAMPHRCPECGTKLRWGILPPEKDR